jgi:SH3 domain protein
MRKNILVALFLILASSATLAETLYVKDILYITLRSGPGNQYSPVKTIKSGTVLNKVETSPDEKYYKVTTQDGLEGWIPEQYVVDTPIAAIKLEAAESRLAKLKDRNSGLNSKVTELSKELRELKTENAKLTSSRDKLEKENNRIKEISKQPLSLANENDELRSQNVSMEKELIRLKQEVQVLDDRTNREWFMIGAGVLGLGVLLGLLLPMFTRRKKRDGWGSI